MNWYKIVNKLCYKLAKKYKLEQWQVTGILVSLSAQKHWKINIRQCIEFLKNKPVTGLVSGSQLNCCKRIRAGENPLDIWAKTSFKYRNFYKSILNPDDQEPVCVDSHIIRWYLDKFPSSRLHRIDRERIFQNRKDYALIQKAVRKEAKILNLVPSHCQAVIWVEQRRGVNF